MDKKPKISRASLIGGNTDGKNLFLEVSVFDGEHTNLLKPVFPFGTKAEAVTEYMKKIIEDNPVFPDDLSSMMNKALFWDNEEEDWYFQAGNSKPVRIKEKVSPAHAPVPVTHTAPVTHTVPIKK